MDERVLPASPRRIPSPSYRLWSQRGEWERRLTAALILLLVLAVSNQSRISKGCVFLSRGTTHSGYRRSLLVSCHMALTDPPRPTLAERLQQYSREILMALALTVAALAILFVTFGS